MERNLNANRILSHMASQHLQFNVLVSLRGVEKTAFDSQNQRHPRFLEQHQKPSSNKLHLYYQRYIFISSSLMAAVVSGPRSVSINVMKACGV